MQLCSYFAYTETCPSISHLLQALAWSWTILA